MFVFFLLEIQNILCEIFIQPLHQTVIPSFPIRSSLIVLALLLILVKSAWNLSNSYKCLIACGKAESCHLLTEIQPSGWVHWGFYKKVWPTSESSLNCSRPSPLPSVASCLSEQLQPSLSRPHSGFLGRQTGYCCGIKIKMNNLNYLNAMLKDSWSLNIDWAWQYLYHGIGWYVFLLGGSNADLLSWINIKYRNLEIVLLLYSMVQCTTTKGWHHVRQLLVFFYLKISS